ncbi:MAG: hypothetical protein MZU97_00375 [Bacillus subtilis]|nr:hypothetical protein [Bacillus subtilis]
MLANKYGYFSDNGKEYVITNPRTPKPWVERRLQRRLRLHRLTDRRRLAHGSATPSRTVLTRLYQDLIKDQRSASISISATSANRSLLDRCH